MHVYAYRNRATGKRALVAWADAATRATLPWPGAAAQLATFVTDAAGTPLRTVSLTPSRGSLAVELDPTPVWVSEDPAW